MMFRPLLLPTLAAALCTLTAAAQPAASYREPVALRSLGLISINDKAVSSLLTRNPMNNGARIAVPLEEEVLYKNTTQGDASLYLWDTDAADGDYTATDFLATYLQDGVFDFPLLTAFDGTMQSSYQIDKKLKVGGTIEITTSDYSEWQKTYLLGMYPFTGDTKGWLGGPNTGDISGVGNLFMTAFPKAQLEAVNVYFYQQPTKFEEGAYLNLQVYIPQVTQQSVVLAAQPLDGGFIRIADIKKTDANLWAPVTNAGVAQVKFDTPVDLEGVPMFFIAIERLAEYDPEENEFCILTDFIGREITDAIDHQNLLAHNSFGRLKGEADYAHPIEQLGGGSGIFQICPVLRISDSDTAVETIEAELPELKVSKEGSSLRVECAVAGEITLYNAAGAAVARANAAAGTCTFDAAGFPAGLYIVRHSSGATAKTIF